MNNFLQINNQTSIDPIISQLFNLQDYQIQAANFALNVPKCGLFLKMGLGKTRIMLSVICQLNPPNHVLVIAPAPIARSSWIDEIKKVGINLRYKSLLINEKGKKYSRKKRLELYEQAKTEPPTVYFISRDLISDMISYFGDSWCFPFLIIDEFHSFKSHSAKRFKMLQKILPYVNHLVGLTGTPSPKGLSDLWSQIYLLDNGVRLGPNITAYRNTFFRPGRYTNGFPIEYIPLPGAKEEIYRRISDITISMENNVIKLPELIFNDIYAYMDDTETEIYKKMAKEQVLELVNGTDVVALNAAVLTSKLVQLASGNIYTDKKHNHFHVHNRKLEILRYIYDNEPTPLLVAYYFKTDIMYITKEFPDAVVFDGSGEMLRKWNNKEIRMLLIQPASVGLGLNFQDGGHTLIWYTLPWSLEQYLQTNSRLHRQGQSETVVIHHILTKNTIDERILKVLADKNISQEELLNAVKITLKETFDDDDDDIGLDELHCIL